MINRGKIAIISDIHGHLPGLQAVLNDANEQDCHRLVCLGDIVDGGNENEQVARYVRDHNIDAVYGNQVVGQFESR